MEKISIDFTDLQKLTWLAWRMGSIGTGDSEEKDYAAFLEWWDEDAGFLLDRLPLDEVKFPDL